MRTRPWVDHLRSRVISPTLHAAIEWLAITPWLRLLTPLPQWVHDFQMFQPYTHGWAREFLSYSRQVHFSAHMHSYDEQLALEAMTVRFSPIFPNTETKQLSALTPFPVYLL